MLFALVISLFDFGSSETKIVSGDLMYTTTHLNVRTRPDVKARKIKKLEPNTSLIASKSDNKNWMIVADLDSFKIGYASSNYLSYKKSKIKAVDKTELISYYVHDEDVYDEPIKTQIRLEIIVEDENVKKSQITKLLETLYNKSIKRTGFKYHKNPTKVNIYVYSSKSEANKGSGNWLGMITTPYKGVTPELKIAPLMNQEDIEGCTDSNALNYDSSATIYDRSCIYKQKNIVNSNLNKDKLIDTWLPLSKGDKIHKKIELFKDPSNDNFLKTTYVDGSYSIDFIEINEFKNKFVYEYENNHGEYFIRDENTLKLYDNFGATDMVLQRVR